MPLTVSSHPRARPGRAGAAFAAILVYVVIVYLNPGVLFFHGNDVGIAKAIAGISIAALGLSWLLADRKLHLGGPAGVLLALHFAVVGVSASWSLWPAMSVDTFLDGLKYLVVFVLIANLVDDAPRARTALHVLALASVIPAVGAIDSWSRGEHLVEGSRASWVGIFGNPNDLAYHLDVGMALALGARDVARRQIVRIFYLGALGVMAAALLLTESRGGLIAAGVVFGLWAIRGLRRGHTLLVVGAIVGLAIWIGPAATWQRAETTIAYEDDASAQGRIDAWRTGVNVLAGRPLTGVGAGAFPLAWGEFAPGDAGPARTAHNTFVQVSAETGLPSFFLFCGAIFVILISLAKVARAEPNPGATNVSRMSSDREQLATMASAVQVGLGGFVVCSLTAGQAYSWPLYFLLGLGAALTRLRISTQPFNSDIGLIKRASG